jgi:hypothetical protein
MNSRPRQLTPSEAHEEIQRIISSAGVSYARHLQERGAERSFDADDVLKVLETGMVSATAEWDEKHQNWKYTVTGRDYDNDPLIVVIALDPACDRLTVITAHGD